MEVWWLTPGTVFVKFRMSVQAAVCEVPVSGKTHNCSQTKGRVGRWARCPRVETVAGVGSVWRVVGCGRVFACVACQVWELHAGQAVHVLLVGEGSQGSGARYSGCTCSGGVLWGKFTRLVQRSKVPGRPARRLQFPSAQGKGLKRLA